MVIPNGVARVCFTFSKRNPFAINRVLILIKTIIFGAESCADSNVQSGIVQSIIVVNFEPCPLVD